MRGKNREYKTIGIMAASVVGCCGPRLPLKRAVVGRSSPQAGVKIGTPLFCRWDWFSLVAASAWAAGRQAH